MMYRGRGQYVCKAESSDCGSNAGRFIPLHNDDRGS